MSKYSINLTPKLRLDLKLVRQRGVTAADPLLPPISELRKVRRGSKASRFFRHIFGHKKLKKIMGANLSMAILLVSIMPATTNAVSDTESVEINIISNNEPNFKTERNIAYPLKIIKITQGFSFFHPGTDFDGVTGDPVNAVKDGMVTEIQHSRFAYGNAVIVDHGNGLTSLYAHLSKINVEKGQKIDTYTKLGELGATGFATGDHLHLEIRDQGRAVNPLKYLPKL